MTSDVGFVEFWDTESASIAKDRFNGHDVRGQSIGAEKNSAAAPPAATDSVDGGYPVRIPGFAAHALSWR